MSELNVDREMIRRVCAEMIRRVCAEMTDDERELLEIAVVCYDVLVEEKESPGHYRYDWAKRHSNYLPAMRALAARFHRGTIAGGWLVPRAFTQCLECGEEIDGHVTIADFGTGAHQNPHVVGTVESTPLSRHLADSLCAFFVLARVHRARGEALVTLADQITDFEAALRQVSICFEESFDGGDGNTVTGTHVRIENIAGHQYGLTVERVVDIEALKRVLPKVVALIMEVELR